MSSALNSIGEALARSFHGKLRLLIAYGSHSTEGDDDYLGVFDDLLHTQSMTAGGLDFWAVNERDFEKYLFLADPFVTEPLLTGTLIHGSAEVFSVYSDRLRTISIPMEATSYLLTKSFQAYCACCDRLANVNTKSPLQQRDYWSLLTFSISYWCFARFYSRANNKVVSLNEVIRLAPSIVKDTWFTAQRYKHSRSPIEPDCLGTWTQIMLALEKT